MEFKTIDTAEASYGCDTTGTITLLNGVATGTDYTTRVGRKINIHSYAVRGVVAYQSATVSLPNLVRILVVLDKVPNGVAPVITDILAVSTSTSYNNLNNRNRFSVLADYHNVIGHQSATSAGNPSVLEVNIHREDISNVFTVFSGTGSTVASVSTGAIWLVTIGCQPNGNGHYALLSCRVRFTDA